MNKYTKNQQYFPELPEIIAEQYPGYNTILGAGITDDGLSHLALAITE